jgi:MarR-like DNA-binding transcriptional regulator SgrR of sgrS sRNA
MATVNNIFTQFLKGDVTVNEFAVVVAVAAKAGTGNSVTTTTIDIADGLRNGLSRHAVARALRSLQKKQLLNWNTRSGNGHLSTIVVR